jgi:hypothetical protein
MTPLSPTRTVYLACSLVTFDYMPRPLPSYLRPFAVMETRAAAERLQPYAIFELPHDEAMVAYRAGRFEPIAAQAAA